MMEPPPARTISGMANLQPARYPRRLTASVWSQIAKSMSTGLVSWAMHVRRHDGGVVVKSVQAAEVADRRRHECLDGGDVAGVELHSDRGVVELLGQRLGARAVDVADHCQ